MMMGRAFSFASLLLLSTLFSACDELETLQVDVTMLQAEGKVKNPVGILFNGSDFCVATLMNDGNVVTAGHCATRSMAVRFQNPGGPMRVVPIVDVVRKAFDPIDMEIVNQTPMLILANKDYAILSVKDSASLIQEFSSFGLPTEQEMIDEHLFNQRNLGEINGEFWLYDIDGTQRTLRKQSGQLVTRGLIFAGFAKMIHSLGVIHTKVVAQQSGAPYVYRDKIYGIATNRVSHGDAEASSGEFSSALITHALSFR